MAQTHDLSRPLNQPDENQPDENQPDENQPNQNPLNENSRNEEGPAPPHPWLILSLLFLLTVILFVARQALSVMAPALRTVFHLSNQQYGRIVSALGFGMMSGEFPMGYLMDRLGARLGLSVAVCWWSAATGSLALAASGLQLGIVQFWKGTGECGAYSGGIKTVTRLFEKKDRTLAIGIFNGGSVIGATIAPPLIVYLLQHYGFRTAFLVPTLAGLLWIPLWWLLYRREPKAEAEAGRLRFPCGRCWAIRPPGRSCCAASSSARSCSFTGTGLQAISTARAISP